MNLLARLGPRGWARTFLALAALLAALFFSMTWMTGDDARYFILSRSLAEGHGYVYAHLPAEPPEPITPPGHPWMVMIVMKLFGTGVGPGKVFSALAFVLAAGFIHRWARLVCGQREGRAWAVAGLGSFGIGLLSMSCWYMAEMSYLAFSFAALYLFERHGRSDRLGPIFALGLIVGYTYLVRSVGLGLVAAGGLWFLAQRRWRPLLAFGAGAALVVAPWVIRTWLVMGALDSYVTQYGGMTGTAGGMAYPWMRIFGDLARAFPQYFAQDLPNAMFFQLFDGRNLLDLLKLGSLAGVVRYGLLGLIVFGFLRRLPRRSVVELYTLFYWLLICAPPFPPQGNWYVYPVLPLAALHLVEGLLGVGELARRFLRAGWAPGLARGAVGLCGAYAVAAALGAGGIHAVKELPRWTYAPWGPERYFYFNNGYMENFGRVMDAAQWIASNRPPDTLVASRVPQHVYAATRLKGWRYDLPEIEGTNLWERMTLAARTRPVALIEDAFAGHAEASFAYGNAHWALRDLFANHANDLEIAYETQPPVTRVWTLRAPSTNP